ncbi:MAG: GGDEF domain-containing phosphodiesterase [Usitatibacteraceae bacterium]
MNEKPNPRAVASALRVPDGQVPTLQELHRTALKSALTNAIDHARMADRVVGVLMILLTRADRLEAMLGVPTSQIMQRALDRVAAAVRPTDRFVRLSDEKLCVLLPNLRSDALPLLAASKIRQAFEAPFSFEGNLVSTRPVIGIAAYPAQGGSAEELLVHADIAERIAVSRDISQYVFHADDRRAADTYVGLNVELREAIRTHQLEVQYQPKIELKTGRCFGVEALLRWTVPGHGAIPPPVIVRVAESNGLISSLTEWILNTSLRHQSEWRQLGVVLDVAVNLSTITLGDGELPGVVGQVMGTWQTDPRHLTLEITESATINDMDYSLVIMNQLKKMGVALSVDDFGTGYSSLSYVKRFPLDELKIDKLFVQHMRDNKGDQQIVRSVIDLAHNFDLKVVAEGVEDDATLKDLKRMGCDIAQGFVISPAMTSVALMNWLKKRK